MFWLLICTANAGLLTSALLTWTVRRLARVHGWMAGPVSRRHVHKLPIPRIGGVAIFLSLLVTIGLIYPGHESMLLAAIPAAWMFSVGLLDDLFGLRPSRKLIAQFVGAILLFAVGFRIPLPFPLGTLSGPLSLMATLVWSVLVMNAINLVDGLDGLASGATICASGAMLFAALHLDDFETALFSAALVGVMLGFLKFNSHPATIFLGDSGSLVTGAVVAAISIRLMQASPWGLVVSVLALAHPLAEVLLSTVRRAITAKPIFRPDRRHFHHRLLDRNLSHRQSTLALVSISLVFGCLAELSARGGLAAAVALALGTIFAAYAFRAFHYAEFKYLANIVRKIMNHRFVIEAHVQLRELCAQIEETRSIGDLRNLLTQYFSAMGFTETVLEAHELDGRRGELIASHGVELVFPLISRQGKLGVLRLVWGLTAPPPIDIEVLQAEVLPVLARTLNAHLLRSREMDAIAPLRKSGPVLLPAMAHGDRAGKSIGWNPMN